MIFNRKSCHFSWIQMQANWSCQNIVLNCTDQCKLAFLLQLNLNTCSVIMPKHGFTSGCVPQSCNCQLSVQWSDAVLWQQAATHCLVGTRGSGWSTRGLGPTMTARGQSIGISIGMLPQTLIMSIMVQKTSKYYTTEFDLEEGFFKLSMYQHFQFTGEYSLTNS